MTGSEQIAAVRAEPVGSDGAGGRKLLVAGGFLAALGAASCCVLPMLLLTIGIGSAWIGSLTALASYHPYFMAAAIVILAVSFWRVYRRPAHCENGAACAEPRSAGTTKAVLWTATVLVIAAAAFPYVAPFL